jgi:hypothetical protein
VGGHPDDERFPNRTLWATPEPLRRLAGVVRVVYVVRDRSTPTPVTAVSSPLRSRIGNASLGVRVVARLIGSSGERGWRQLR